jgi:hypothetical protein
MTVVECPIEGTYLIRDESQGPPPLGKSVADVSTVVHRYRFGWVCAEDGYTDGTTIGACWHIKAAQRSWLSLPYRTKQQWETA